MTPTIVCNNDELFMVVNYTVARSFLEKALNGLETNESFRLKMLFSQHHSNIIKVTFSYELLFDW